MAAIVNARPGARRSGAPLVGGAMALAPGTFIDRYELMRQVARGGMGSVWEARLRRAHGFEKRFAVKTLLPHLAEEPSFRAMFLDEMRIASNIFHPNVCEVHDFGEAHGTLFLALEWIEGISVQTLLKNLKHLGRVTPDIVAVRIVSDVAAGLHAAHELRDPEGALLQVVHRDVTPHNIILRPDGIAKLLDFGIAKARNRLADETTAGTAKGKLRFMAPEQLP
jgi:eukaryotic-like serine/threonine-protein kinase